MAVELSETTLMLGKTATVTNTIRVLDADAEPGDKDV